MKKLINLNLFKERRLEQEYKDIKAIEKDGEYIFSLDGVKTIIGATRFTRENNEYKTSPNSSLKSSVTTNF